LPGSRCVDESLRAAPAPREETAAGLRIIHLPRRGEQSPGDPRASRESVAHRRTSPCRCHDRLRQRSDGAAALVAGGSSSAAHAGLAPIIRGPRRCLRGRRRSTRRPRPRSQGPGRRR
jgi:hypothetical protein